MKVGQILKIFLMIIHFSQSKYQAVNLSLLSGSYFHPILLFVLLYTFLSHLFSFSDSQ